MEKKVQEKLHERQVKILDDAVKIFEKYDIDYFLAFGTLLGAVRHQGFIPWDDDIDIGMTRKDFKKFMKVYKQELGEEYVLDYYGTNKKHYQNVAKIRLKNTVFLEKTDSEVNKNHGIWIDIFVYDNVNKLNSFNQRLKWKMSNYVETLMTIKCGMSYYKPGVKKNILKFILKFIPTNMLTGIYIWYVSIGCKNNSKYICNYAGTDSFISETFERETFFPTIKLSFEGKKYSCIKDYDKFLTQRYGDYMKLPPKDKRLSHNPLYIKFEDGEEHFYE